MKEAFDAAALAIFAGDTAALEAALRTPGLATHEVHDGHRTLLQIVACEAQHIPDPDSATRLLIEAGSETRWPMISAAGCSSLSVVETMLELGVDVDAENDWTPLDEALYWNNADIAAYLVDHGADLNRLRRAAGLGNIEMTEAFFNGSTLDGAAGPIDGPFRDTFTAQEAGDPTHIVNHAFVMAANCGQRATVELLRHKGADVNAAPPGYHWNGTALHAAVWRGDLHLVQWLLDHGADPSLRDGLADADALGWATHHNRPEIVRFLTSATPSNDVIDHTFDLCQLYVDIDAKRQEQALSWAALSKEVGVSTSTIRRYQDADDAEADGVLLLIRWVGTAPEHYVEGVHGGELLSHGGWVRVDTARIAEALDDPAIAKRNRLTIQGLIAAAQKADASIASLTRQSSW